MPKTSALDHSATLPWHNLLKSSKTAPLFNFAFLYRLIQFDSGGIRTHATEGTGALNQRLRPLGHAILSLFEKKVEAIAQVRESHFNTYQDLSRRHKALSVLLTPVAYHRYISLTYTDVIPPVCAQNRPLSEVGFEPTPT